MRELHAPPASHCLIENHCGVADPRDQNAAGEMAAAHSRCCFSSQSGPTGRWGVARSRSIMSAMDLVDCSPEVADALKSGSAVVALESTIITHGMPYPENRKTGERLEKAVRNAGATPAMIAVLEGRFKVGLNGDAMDRLARGENVSKASRRDLSFLAAMAKSGGTTVAATMAIADFVGVSVFATGGIGGVHRGAEQNFDISADLIELARTRVAVVCSGAKSILDIGKTLEFLETQGVAVCGFRCDEFPAFYTKSSGFKLDWRCDSVRDLARVVRLQRQVGPGGVLIANPVPDEAALASAEIDREIERALSEAASSGVTGKSVTPFLLRRVLELTGGRSLYANMALVEANAILAARLAVELASR